ncbi:MAG: bifunctional glutamate N-acetyltransferase/amino-acid acetyltransferase ArgJ, partial [Desulforhopalus sp.]
MVTEIKGFSFAAVDAGIRYVDRLDLGLVFSEVPCITAGVFTRNQVKAAPLLIDQERLQAGYAQAILVNSGCANACTGREGMTAARETSRLVSELLDIPDEMVQLSSTGVIGEQLPLGPFQRNIPKLVAALSPENFTQVSRAIMTTDTVPKTAVKKVSIGEREVSFMGMAKGSGMIMPNMATMLAFVFTDATITFAELHASLQRAVDRTFNRISVDGDTSTNDMVLVMANGTAKNPQIDGGSPEYQHIFHKALEGLLKDLALQIVRDGEGATKTITVSVRGAENDLAAEKIARTVATSSLVKTAFFGEDANWGRILAAMGRSGVQFAPERVDISFNDVLMVQNGRGLGRDVESEATRVLKEKEFT